MRISISRRKLATVGPDAERLCTGFTLIEILIVVAILLIAGVIVIPVISSAAGVQVRSAANMLAADLEYARSMAITTGRNHSVVFDLAGNSYQLEDDTAAVIKRPLSSGDYVVNLGTGELNKVSISSVDYTSVVFDCLGSSNNGCNIVLATTQENVTVTVEPVTGFIAVGD